MSLNGWEAVNYIYFDHKFASVIRMGGGGGFCKIMHFEKILQLIPQL